MINILKGSHYSLLYPNPDGSGSGTAIAFSSTNCTGQLAFLDNKPAFIQHEFSPESDLARLWELKDRTLPENGSDGTPATLGNQITITSTLQ
jgi:hypothetical protein